LVIDSLINKNEFDLGVIELVNDYKELISVFGDELEDVHDVSTSKISLRPINSIHAVDIGTSWLRKYESFLSTFPDVLNCAKDSAMDKLAKKVGVLVEGYRKDSSATETSFTCTFVLDTSALIDSPDLLKFIKPEELVVVSKRVIDELDDKKRDENLRPSIAKATRGLQEFPSRQMHFCDGDMSVLSADYRMKGDNLILSVAVKYRQHNPILITNDKNLTLKARAEGITAISVGEFRLGRRV
jgi:rRNA-processing protein FCF1